MGPGCEWGDQIALICFMMWEVPELRTMMRKAFSLQLMDKMEFVAWCKQEHEIYYTNYIKVYLWVCQMRGL